MKLEMILQGVKREFETAPIWQQNVEPIAGAPMKVGFVMPSEPVSDEARARYYQPAGEALALAARHNGATAHTRVALKIEQGPVREFEYGGKVERDETVSVSAEICAGPEGSSIL